MDLTDYIKKRFPEEWEEIKRKAYFFSDNHIKDIFCWSKHKLEAEIFLCKKILKFKYGKKQSILRDQKKAMPEPVYNELVAYFANNIKLQLAIRFEGLEGSRIEDTVRIKSQDIDFNNHIVHIYNRKCKKWYKVPLDINLEHDLKVWLETKKKEIAEHNDYIFFSPYNNGNISENFLRNKIAKALQKLNINKIYGNATDGRNLHLYSSHSLRGHAATRIYKKTHDINIAKQLLNHINTDTTERYIEDYEDDLFKAMRK